MHSELDERKVVFAICLGKLFHKFTAENRIFWSINSLKREIFYCSNFHDQGVLYLAFEEEEKSAWVLATRKTIRD